MTAITFWSNRKTDHDSLIDEISERLTLRAHPLLTRAAKSSPAIMDSARPAKVSTVNVRQSGSLHGQALNALALITRPCSMPVASQGSILGLDVSVTLAARADAVIE